MPISTTVFYGAVALLVTLDLAALGIAVVNSRQMASDTDVNRLHSRVNDVRGLARRALREAEDRPTEAVEDAPGVTTPPERPDD